MKNLKLNKEVRNLFQEVKTIITTTNAQINANMCLRCNLPVKPFQVIKILHFSRFA